ncbi:hypothetical protein DFH11DRAFT_1556864 [Phellopilus nigrolimitatus]|nr:hypothetical protein DFH11DRAFT_1556864 [Phellopilus nigrolimitatus]
MCKSYDAIVFYLCSTLQLSALPVLSAVALGTSGSSDSYLPIIAFTPRDTMNSFGFCIWRTSYSGRQHLPS